MSSNILDMLFKSESKEHKNKMHVFLDEMEEEYETSKGGFSSGMSVGQGLDTPGGSAAAAANTVAGVVGSARSKDSTGVGAPKATTTAPSAPTTPGSSPTSASSSNKTYADSVKAMDCEKCAKGICDHEHMDKAVNSRSLAIPRHLRGPYDADNIRRSATQQTSRMYTSIAPDVDDTFNHIKDKANTDPRLNAVKAQENNSRTVRELREKIAASCVPRRSQRFTR